MLDSQKLWGGYENAAIGRQSNIRQNLLNNMINSKERRAQRAYNASTLPLQVNSQLSGGSLPSWDPSPINDVTRGIREFKDLRDALEKLINL